MLHAYFFFCCSVWFINPFSHSMTAKELTGNTAGMGDYERGLGLVRGSRLLPVVPFK